MSACTGSLPTRTAAFTPAEIQLGLFLDLGYLWAAWDPQKQGWHDKIAGTFVITPL